MPLLHPEKVSRHKPLTLQTQARNLRRRQQNRNRPPRKTSRRSRKANLKEQATPELDLSTPGIIAIRDLEKLEGVEEPPEEEP